MATKADPSLLSLLQKIANPIQSLDVHTSLKGVFAPPEQWKLTDEANPGIFTYTLEIFRSHFTSGKIEPRKLTEKELKEQQQAKNKKGGKKETKEEEKPAEVDPHAEQKRLEWQALSEEEKFHRTQEDPFKAFSLQWADHKKDESLNREQLDDFESHVTSGHLEVILTRKPDMNEEDIAKLKKSKPKALNLGELYAAKYRGKINLDELNQPGVQKLHQRVHLTFAGDLPAECVKIEAEKCYALIQISLSESLNPLVEEAKPKPEQLLGQREKTLQKGGLLVRLTEQIRKGARAISQQYSNFFAKEKEHSDEKKFTSSANTNLLNVSTLRINEINKRKEQFLTQFVASGKFSILGERLTKTIRAIVIDKCRKEKLGSVVTKETLQHSLSELNVFFRQILDKTLDQCIQSEASNLHEDLILNHEYSRSIRKQAVGGISESKEDREVRLAGEYETINRLQQAQEKYLNLVFIHNQSVTSLQHYARFCLRNGKFDQAFALYSKINESSHEFKHKLIFGIFQVHRGRERQAITLLSQLQQQEGVTVEEKTTIHLLLSFVYERLGEEKRSEKHLSLAEKYHQLKHNPNLKINPPRNPYLEPAPKVPKPGKFVSALTTQQSQQIRLSLLNYFIDYNFHPEANSYIAKIAESDKKKQIQTLILFAEGKFEAALELIELLVEKDKKNMELLLLKADICFKSDRMFECEEIFLYILKLKPTPSQAYSIYLRLALTYLNRKSYQDAKITFNKALELKNNSSIGWLGLGIANLELGLLKESEEAFNLSSIYNPLSTQPTKYLKQISNAIDKQNQKTYKYLASNE